jgi:hypothetical protein
VRLRDRLRTSIVETIKWCRSVYDESRREEYQPSQKSTIYDATNEHQDAQGSTKDPRLCIDGWCSKERAGVFAACSEHFLDALMSCHEPDCARALLHDNPVDIVEGLQKSLGTWGNPISNSDMWSVISAMDDHDIRASLQCKAREILEKEERRNKAMETEVVL